MSVSLGEYCYLDNAWRAFGRPALGADGLPAGPRDRAAALTPGAYIPGDEFTPDSVGVRAFYGPLVDGPEPNVNGVIYLNPGDYHGTRFRGSVRPNANGLFRFYDCEFPGQDPTTYSTSGQTAAVQNTNASAFFELYDCTIDGFWWNETLGTTVPTVLTQTSGTPTYQAKQSAYSGGVRGGNILMRRCRVRGFHDAFAIVGDGWDVQTCRVTGYYMMGGVGSSADGMLHSDGIQFHYGKTGLFKWNFFGGPRDNADYSGAAPQENGQDDFNNGGLGMFQQENYTDAATQFFGAFTITENWIAGGNTVVNLNYKNGNDLSGLAITNNRILRRGTTTPVKNDVPAGNYIHNKTSLNVDLTGNVLWDWDGPITGSSDPVPITTLSG